MRYGQTQSGTPLDRLHREDLPRRLTEMMDTEVMFRNGSGRRGRCACALALEFALDPLGGERVG